MFQCRLVNVSVGCATGFCLLLAGCRSDWVLSFGLALAVLISTYVVRVKTMWCQAPITAAIAIAAIISHNSSQGGIEPL
jgi:uncharacterized membrane protein